MANRTCPRVNWMRQVLEHCFSKHTEDGNKIQEDPELIDNLVNFLNGKLGQTLVVYYQKPIKIVEKNERVETSSIYTIYYNQQKNIELRNRAAFFIRNIEEGREMSYAQSQIASDYDIVFGEITSDSIIGMNKVIYNYLYQKFDEIGNDELGEIEPEQKNEFKKILEQFASDMQETVESLISGVQFAEIPPKIREFMGKDHAQTYVEDPDNYHKTIEEIYESWINTLSKEIEDMDKDPPYNSDDEGPRRELDKWKFRNQRLTKVIDFINLSADSRLTRIYFISIGRKKQGNPHNNRIPVLSSDMKAKLIEATTAQAESKDIVKYLSTLEIYFEPLYNGTPDTIIDSLQSLMNSLKLISFTARHYDNTKMSNLFSRITEQMIINCKDYILDKRKSRLNADPTYLWSRAPNELITKFQNCIRLLHVYREKYNEAKANSTSTNKENNFEYGDHQLFGKFEQFCKRLAKLIDLFTTIKQFEDIKNHKLDSMETIEAKYEAKLEAFKSKTNYLLTYTDTNFDKDYVVFNLAISEIENELHKIINEEFKKLNWIEKKLKLLAKYEKILTKPGLQSNLKSEKIEIYSGYKREIDTIQQTFESHRNSPRLQRNMPKISGKIKWAKHLFNRIFPYINNFKDISIKESSETVLSYYTTNTLLYTYIQLNEKFFEQFVESAKTKLSAPLLVFSPETGPRVNLDLYVLQLIREAKCMLRMNCIIPESAKIILLQEEKFKKYYNELNFLVKEYHRVIFRIKPEVDAYFRAHKNDLNWKLQPLKTTVNWSSMNIDTNLMSVFTCLQRFEYAIDAFFEILENRVHTNMMSIRTLELLHIPENATSKTNLEILKLQEDYVKEKSMLLMNKNTEIENAIKDIIEGIKNYEVDPKISKVEDKVLFKLINDYEEKFSDFLMTATKNSLIGLKDRITSRNKNAIFKVDVVLVSNTIEINPKVTVIQDTINKLAKSVIFSMVGIKRWSKNDKSGETGSFHTTIANNNEIVRMILLLTGSVTSNNIEIENYLKEVFDPFKPLWTDNIEKRIKEFLNKKNKTYFDYEEKLKEYTNIEHKIKAIEDEKNIGAICLNTRTIKAVLERHCMDWKNAYSKELLRTTRASAKELNELIVNFQQKLNKKVEKIEELKEMVDTIEQVRKNEANIEMQIKPFVQLYNLVKQHTKESDFERYQFHTKETFESKWNEVLIKAGEIRDELQRDQISYKKKLYDDVKNLVIEVASLKNDYESNGPTKAKDPIDAHEKIDKFRTKVQILKRAWNNIKDGEKLFNVSSTDYPQLKAIEDDLNVYGNLYDLYMAVLRQIETWKDLQWSDIGANFPDMENKILEYSSSSMKVNKRLWNTHEYIQLKDQIKELDATVNAFRTLIGANYEEIHWQQISDELKVKEVANVKNDQGLFKLKLLFDAKIHEHQIALDEIQSQALAQEKIKTALKSIDDQWKSQEFKFDVHSTRKEVYMLLSQPFQEIKNLLEDHSGKIAGMKSNRSLPPDLQKKVKDKESIFQNVMNTMELWLSVQTLWNNLQSFFIGGDIQKDLPTATIKFKNADKEWIKVQSKAFEAKFVMSLCSGSELSPQLTEIDVLLKDCQKQLDTYLESKRGAFPRFYFVSNLVLLEILSKKSEPKSIKPNLQIIFDAITDVDFSPIDNKTILTIKQNKSESNVKDIQLVDISNYAVKCDGKIEDWLNELVRSMQYSIRDLFERCYADTKQYFDVPIDANNKESFQNYILNYVGQVALFGLQILDTRKLEEYVLKTTDKESYRRKVFDGHIEDPIGTDLNNILSYLADLCRRETIVNAFEIVKLETLITVHVHSQDIYSFINNFKENTKPVAVTDYDWLKQTRVYWYENKNSGIKTCLINITDVPFEYGYEFLGAKERMCITKLTDKCYITLAQALGMGLGGAPAGPAGTGKTETVKDMGRTMGVFVLVTNCAPEHKYKSMATIFKGLCKSGAWGCFDEFNRIQLDTLSVLAMIVSAIQECKRKNEPSFKFPEMSKDGVNPECVLLPTTAYFITMNPGYSGRQELPENLKVLFRGVTMMLPNRKDIIRVKLSSYGFDNNEDLSDKFTKLYSLCEDQLSKQKHYDFGLRNILSVLRHAGNLKKIEKNPDKEEKILYNALRGMNESKLVPDDIRLFVSLINDVFPKQGKDEEKNSKEETDQDKNIRLLILKVLEDEKLDARDGWVKKVIQTYQTYFVRHGFMIVGDAGSGKTTILEVLKEAMNRDPKYKENKFKITKMNPKAIDDKYLYIERIIDQYINGVFTELWKKCNDARDTMSNNWLVCDGPIDSIWIESLNTVLDDNKILTLSNNERIKMVDSCRLVFECENLRNATLATVSRAGMIYITDNELSFPPLINTWFKTNDDLPKDNNNPKVSFLRDLIDKKYISEDFLNEVEKSVTLCMGVSLIIRVKNFLLMLRSMMMTYRDATDKILLEKIVVFCFVWGVSGLLEEEQRKILHRMLQKIKAPIPELSDKTTIFDYTLKDNDWAPWKTEEYENLKNEMGNFSQLLVPTMDSTRAIFMIESIKRVKIEKTERTHPCLLLGDAGTAKTSTILLYKKLRLNESKDGGDKKQVMKRVNFSSATTPTNFQSSLDDELEKSGGDYAPLNDKFMTVFIDDLSMPYVNVNGDQVTLELVRQILEGGSYYDIVANTRGQLKKINRLEFVAAMNHPKGGKNDIPNRLKRQFFMFNMVLPNQQSINDIYGKIVSLWFTNKDGEAISKQAQYLTGITTEVLNRMKKKFIPTPIKFHYNFNMRELSRTFQGVFQADKSVMKTSQNKLGIAPEIYLLLLWKHEVTRVFCDKLRDVEDKQEFKNIVDTVLSETFEKETFDKLKEDYLFCDYLRDVEIDQDIGKERYFKVYELIKNIDILREKSDFFMQSLKSAKGKKQVDLVLFDDCLKYLIRITRIIQTPQGSCMLVGVGGSGKQSLTRLGSFCCQHEIVQLSTDKSDRIEEFKNEFRQIYQTMVEKFNPAAGTDIVRHTFLMTDAELKLDSFLELVSSFLSTGEIANLFPKKEDKNAIILSTRSMLSKMKEWANKEPDDNEVWIALINIVKDNLHLSLCFSPSSDKFRAKFIKFPVLFNNCTIIWLLPWPEEALISVIQGFVKANPKLVLEGKDDHKKQLFQHIAGVHVNIQEVCQQYLNKMRKYVYVTPKSYLSFIEEYIKIYIEKKSEISEKENNINSGLSKLEAASQDIEVLKIELNKEMEIVKEEKRKVEEMEADLMKQSEIVAALEAQVNAEAEKCNREAEIISEESARVQEELKKAEPLLIEAEQKMKDITGETVKSFGSKSPNTIRFYFECAAIIMNKRILPVSDYGYLVLNEKIFPKIPGFPPSWDPLLLFYALPNGIFIKTITEWGPLIKSNELNINDETLELIRPYLEAKYEDKEVFDPSSAEKAGGPPGKQIAGFCRAVTGYVYAVKTVLPKKKLVDQKNMELAIAMAKLAEQEEKKRAVLAQKKDLEDQLNKARREKEAKEEEAAKKKQTVDRATHLINSLAGEKHNWKEDSKKFDMNKKALLGDAAICAAFLAYAGPFNFEFRNKLIKEIFRGDIIKRGIPYSEDLIVEDFLEEEYIKSEWVMNKLPSDTLSIQNGILVTSASRYPLLIDPQNQAKAWLLTTYPEIESNKQIETQIQAVKKFENFLVPLMYNGDRVIIEGIENEVDSKLDPILDKQFKAGNTKMKKLIVGDKEIDFNENFKLYLLCKLITPHFTPELAAKTTIIDFCVTFEGLEQQLQGLVISKEQRSLEDTLKSILSSITQNKASLQQCQRDILDNLSKEGSLMENQEIIIVLNNSKTKSDENNRKIAEAEEKKIDINQKREKYLPVATRGAVLYFSIVEMQEISKMYSTSLQQFEGLFVYSIEKANENIPMNNTEQRVKNIVKYMTKHVYKYVVRGLFEKDKTAFILNVAFKILTREKYDGHYCLRNEDISHFVKAGNTLMANQVEDCPIEYIGSKAEPKPKEWMNIKALVNWKFNGSNQVFLKLIEKIKDGSDLSESKDPFRIFFNAPDAEKKIPFEDLYNQSNPKLAAFYKLFFVRALREDRTIVAANTNFIPVVLEDKDFLVPYSEGVEDYYKITEARTPIPILYLLSAGADPTSEIEYLAFKKKKKILPVSMGENQEAAAQANVETARMTGDWVLLQNCHLGLDYMSKLDLMLRNPDIEYDPEMRIWLSCEPNNDFPIGLLHQSLKITNAPPKGIKKGMQKTFKSVITDDTILTFDFDLWKNIIFTLAFLHSLVLERRNYGALGWCIPYDFNNSDLAASILFVEKQFSKAFSINDKAKPETAIDYNTVKSVISQILYGGRITDKKDDELFLTMIRSYIEKDFFDKKLPLFQFNVNKNDTKSQSMDYLLPPEGLNKTQDFINHIATFPDNDPAQVFGLHGSAEITFRLKQFNELLDTIQKTQPKDGGSGGGVSKEESVKKMLESINVPEPFIEKDFRNKIENYSMGSLGVGLKVPMNNVLLQEIIRIQAIINLVSSSIYDIKEALEGRLMMTEEIVKCINSIYDTMTPNSWLFDVNGNEISWLTPKVGQWIIGLNIRAERLREWLNCGNEKRPCYYLPGLLNPQGFFAAFKQEVFKILRDKDPELTLDAIDLKFEPHQSELDPNKYLTQLDKKKSVANKDKLNYIIIYGLYIEGAIWDGVLKDDPNVNSRKPIKPFPVIYCSGNKVEKGKQNTGNTYPAPLYKYPKRTDKYHIIDVGVKVSGNEMSEKYTWQKRGVALLCNAE